MADESETVVVEWMMKWRLWMVTEEENDHIQM
jgi:hypothetical protein